MILLFVALGVFSFFLISGELKKSTDNRPSAHSECAYDGSACFNDDGCCSGSCDIPAKKCIPNKGLVSPWKNAEEFQGAYKSLNHTVLPDGRIKQTLLADDGITLKARYIENWTERMEGQIEVSQWEVVQTFQSSYRGFDEVTLPDGRIKQTLLSDDGKSSKHRYIINWNKPNVSVTQWELGDQWEGVYKSFNHTVLPDGRIKQTLLADDGRTLKARYISDWPSAPKLTNWQIVETYQGNYSCFDEVTLPDKRIKQTLLSNDGRSIKVRYINKGQ